jgi:hypothetical protein
MVEVDYVADTDDIRGFGRGRALDCNRVVMGEQERMWYAELCGIYENFLPTGTCRNASTMQ